MFKVPWTFQPVSMEAAWDAFGECATPAKILMAFFMLIVSHSSCKATEFCCRRTNVAISDNSYVEFAPNTIMISSRLGWQTGKC